MLQVSVGSHSAKVAARIQLVCKDAVLIDKLFRMLLINLLIKAQHFPEDVFHLIRYHCCDQHEEQHDQHGKATEQSKEILIHIHI